MEAIMVKVVVEVDFSTLPSKKSSQKMCCTLRLVRTIPMPALFLLTKRYWWWLQVDTAVVDTEEVDIVVVVDVENAMRAVQMVVVMAAMEKMGLNVLGDMGIGLNYRPFLCRTFFFHLVLAD